MALKTVVVSANGERKLLDLMADRALTLQSGEKLILPPGLLKKRIEDAADSAEEIVLTDAEGQTYTVFLSTDSEVVVAQAGGTFPTNPNSIPAAPATVSTIPLPTNPNSYAKSSGASDGGIADFIVPIGLGVVGVGAIVALAAQQDDDDDNNNSAPTPIPNNTVFGGTLSGSVTEAGINGPGVPEASGTLTATDPDGPENAFIAAGGNTTYGSYTLSANGSWTYTLNNDNGTVNALNNGAVLPDGFVAMTADGSTRTVAITINGANDVGLANNTIISGDLSGVVVEAGAVNSGTPSDTGVLLANDPDGPDNAFTASSGTSAGGYGTFSVTQNGVWTYNLLNGNATVEALNNGAVLPDSFVVTAADGSTQTVSITINGANDVGAPNNSTIGGDRFGAVRESGVSSIGSADAGVPSVTGTLTALDPDGPDNAFMASSGNSANGYGTFSITTGGAWTYVLTNSNPVVNALAVGSLALTDSFTVSAADGTSQVVSITISGTNDAPIAAADTYTASGAPLVVAEPAGVLANDPDPEGNPRTALLVGNVSNGTLVFNSNGSFTYTANAGFNGADSFTYRASDGTASSALTTVTINVSGNNRAPVAADDAASGAEGAAITVNVLANDSDADQSLTAANIISFSPASSGSAVNNGDGTFTYTATDPNFSGTDSFTYTVRDAVGATDSATVTITVNPVNDGPVNTLPGPGSYGTLEDTPQLLTGLSVSDIDVGTGDLTVTLSVTAGSLSVANATAAVSGNGTATVIIIGTQAVVNGLLTGVTFTPAQDATSTVTLTLNTSDNGNTGAGNVLSDTDTTTITLTAVNDAPMITDGATGPEAASAIVIDDHLENTNTVTTISARDVDGPGQPSFSIIGGAQGDFFTIDAVTGQLNFRAPPDFENGQGSNVPGLAGLLPGNNYEVIVAASDSLGASDTQTINVYVQNDAFLTEILNLRPAFSEPPADGGTTGGGLGTIGGGGSGGFMMDADDEARIEIPENRLFVTQLISRSDDADLPIYRIAAGEDADRFVLDPSTGVLSFISPPDFEVPGDKNGNNEYRVLVQVSDDDGTDYQLITVAIQNSEIPIAVNDRDTVSEAGGQDNATVGANPSPQAGNVLTNDVYEGDPAGELVVTDVGFTTGSGTSAMTQEVAITSDMPFQIDGAYGTLTISRDGSYSYALNQDSGIETLAGGATASEIFSYAIANDVIVDGDGDTSNDNTATDATTLTITIVGANDATFVDLNGTGPTGENATAVYTENATVGSLLSALATVNDPDSQIEFATIRLTNPLDGELESLSVDVGTTGIFASAYNPNTGVLTLVGPGSDDSYQAVLRTLRYQNLSDTPNEVNRIVNVVLNDGTENSNLATVTILVNAGNDAPTVLAPTQIMIDEDVPVAITGIVFEDVDAGDGTVRATLAVDSGSLTASSSGDVTVGGNFAALTLTGSVEDINAFVNVGNVIFVTDTNDTDNVSLTTNITDLGNNGAGGPMATNTTTDGNTTLVVRPMNDAPTVDAPVELTVTEDTASPITGISFDDVDAGADTVRVTLSVDSGSLTAAPVMGVVVGGNATALTLTGSIAAIEGFIAGNRVNFTTAPNSTAPVTLTTRINDLGNNGFGGQLLSDPATTILQVTAENDAPTVTAPMTITVAEDTVTNLTGIVFADVDSGANDVRATLSIGGGTANGSLGATSTADVTVGGTAAALTLTGSVADINAFIAAGNLRFTPILNSTADVTLTSNINDLGNSGTGLSMNAGAGATTTLDLTAVNDAPTITAPIALTVTEDVATVLTGISFADVDAGTANVTATFSVASGSLTATQVNGVLLGGAPNALTLTGSIADINAFIAGSNLRFTTASDSTAPVTLTTNISDLGNTGAGGAQLAAPATTTLQVTAMNDAPTVTAPATIAVVEDTTTNLTGIVFADVDSAVLDVRATLSIGEGMGTLSASSSADVTVGGTAIALTLTGSVAEINAFIAAGNLRFTPVADSNTDVTLTSTINDLGNSGAGGTLNAAVAGSTILDITAVNDAPTIDLNGAGIGTGNTAIVTAPTGMPVDITQVPVVITDVDPGDMIEGATVVLTGIADGAAESLAVTLQPGITAGYSPVTGTLTLSGTASTATYQTVLNSLTYSNTDPTPTQGARTVAITLNDGTAVSNTASISVSVIVDAPPTFTMLSFAPTSFSFIGSDVNDDAVTGSGAGLGPTAVNNDGNVVTTQMVVQAAALDADGDLYVLSDGTPPNTPVAQLFIGTVNGEGITATDSANSIAMYGFGGDDTLNGSNGADFLFGGDLDDDLNGSGGSDYLHGGTGADSLNGGDGNDSLVGASGNDTLEMGSGSDIAQFLDPMGMGEAANGSDVLNGFNANNATSGNDTVDLSALFAGVAAGFRVENEGFVIVAGVGPDQYLLYVDLDGNASGAAAGVGPGMGFEYLAATINVVPGGMAFMANDVMV